MKSKSKAIQHLKNEEKKAIRDYDRAEKHSKGKGPGLFRHIKGEEKEHLQELGRINKGEY